MRERVIVGLGIGVALIAALLLLQGDRRDSSFARGPRAEVEPAADVRADLRGADAPTRTAVQPSDPITPAPSGAPPPATSDSWPRLDEKSVEDWIADLRHDSIPHNAERAKKALCYEQVAIPGLKRALWSDDYQQRQLAAMLLLGSQNKAPDTKLIEVVVEGLTLDNERIERYSGYGQLYQRAWLLSDNVQAAEPWLSDALAFGDRQAKFCAALCLSTHPSPPNPELAVSVLAPHLRDDDLPGNGELACCAISILERHVPGLALSCYPAADEQARRFLDRIIANPFGSPHPVGYHLDLLDDRIR